MALMAVVVLLVAACGGNPTSDDEAQSPTAASQTLETLSVPAEDACPAGKTKPVQIEALIRVFRAHGIVMFDDPECRTTNTERQASNAPKFGPNPRRGDAYDEVVSTQGWIFCGLFAAPFQPLEPVERLRFEGDKETLVRFGAVQCIIYPDAASETSRLRASAAPPPILPTR